MQWTPNHIISLFWLTLPQCWYCPCTLKRLANNILIINNHFMIPSWTKNANMSAESFYLSVIHTRTFILDLRLLSLWSYQFFVFILPSSMPWAWIIISILPINYQRHRGITNGEFTEDDILYDLVALGPQWHLHIEREDEDNWDDPFIEVPKEPGKAKSMQHLWEFWLRNQFQ